MLRNPIPQRLRALLIAWCIVWAGTWLYMTAGLLHSRARSEPALVTWLRTGAFVAAWAGVFALRALGRR